MHMLQSLFYLTTALRVSGVTIDLSVLWVACTHHPQHTQISSNSSTVAADNNMV
jgi:hypothetical protein